MCAITNWAQETRQVATNKIWTGSTLGHVHSWSRSVEISRVIWGEGLPFIACNVNGRMCCSESQKGSGKDHCAAFRLAAGCSGWLALLPGFCRIEPCFFPLVGCFMSKRLRNVTVRQNWCRSCCYFTPFYVNIQTGAVLMESELVTFLYGEYWGWGQRN